MGSIIYKHRLLVVVILAIIIDMVPFLKLPFIWTETFFHEISHGLMALLTGGSIHSITLNYSGSGLCVSQGGIQFLVTFAGYTGSAVFGLSIYMLTENIKTNSSKILLALLLGVILLTIVLWAKNLSTYVILSSMLIIFSMAYAFSSKQLLNYFLKFIGVFVLLDAIRSPLVLVDGRNKGDGAALSDLTYIPEILWVGVWFLFGLACLYWMYQISYKRHNKSKTAWI